MTDWNSVLSVSGTRLRKIVAAEILTVLAAAPKKPMDHLEVLERLYPLAEATTPYEQARRAQLGFLIVTVAHGPLKAFTEWYGRGTRWIFAPSNEA